FIESVIIPHTKDKYTFCISSQIGCAMSCKFCVTGLHGLKRNLTAGEIIEQVLLLSKIVKPTAIVFMGQGEPINNYKNVKISIMNLKDHHGFNFSAKKITVSTSGLIPGLIKLQKETGIKMAYSLNATNQNDRTRIMDVNKIIDFESGLSLLKSYLTELNKNSKRNKLMIEYVMFDGFNDNDSNLEKLIAIAKDLKYVFINLIPYNEHEFAYADFELKKSEKCSYFFKKLMDNDIQAFIRYEHGSDIYAACGMLKHKLVN
ncbi:radical SAM protein, partial [Candidatus Woesearchaeota archaeon]|nr:radical SAM protein [Candidatus Woesearchaeota archaeon]